MDVQPSTWDGLAVTLSGRAAYRPTWSLQQRIHDLRRTLRLPDTLLLVEHDPVITLGRHGNRDHVLASPPARLPDIVRIDRGGDVTYHGPGQITAYLILDLRAHDLGVRAFVTKLEEAVIGTLSDFGIAAERRPGLVGVWTIRDDRPAKIAAAGVRIARGVSYHGVALNVGDCLEGFRSIVPCGLTGAAVTSMRAVRGAEIDPHAVAETLCARLGEGFHIDFRHMERSAPRKGADVLPLAANLQAAARRGARKPGWLHMELPGGATYARVHRVLADAALHTVCQGARCPNRRECWNSGTATFMILGAVCTRGCRFCAVPTGEAGDPDGTEPHRVAAAAATLGLRHAVVTSVTRDDLGDGGAQAFVDTIRELRGACPEITVEVLIPDFAGSGDALENVIAARPDVLNHNVETVPRLYPHVRPGADFRRSLCILRRASAAGRCVKSGFMVGLGESAGEIRALLADLRETGCDRVTIGQYLQPDRSCLTVKRYWSPDEFERLRRQALALGFRHAESGPLVRSSYHAAESML